MKLAQRFCRRRYLNVVKAFLLERNHPHDLDTGIWAIINRSSVHLACCKRIASNLQMRMQKLGPCATGGVTRTIEIHAKGM